jgi:hypothetical protein
MVLINTSSFPLKKDAYDHNVPFSVVAARFPAVFLSERD